MPTLNNSSVALITASSAGLGAAVARLFAAKGHKVVINYHSNAEKAHVLVEELSAQDKENGSERFVAIQADMSRKEEVGRLVKEALEKMGRLDVVISNHGWTKIRNFQDLDDNVEEEDWDRCWNMNVKSHLWLYHAAKKELEKSDGCFITTASVAGVKPSGSSMAYSVTKAAQLQLVKALAVTSTIRVNSVSPGLMLTDWGLQFPETKIETTKKKSPLGRLATVEEVARQMYCLAESESTTGTNTIIDGGIHLGK